MVRPGSEGGVVNGGVIIKPGRVFREIRDRAFRHPWVTPESLSAEQMCTVQLSKRRWNIGISVNH